MDSVSTSRSGSSWGELPRGDTTDVASALKAIARLLAHPACANREVRCQVGDRQLERGRAELEEWMRAAEADGYIEMRWFVDPLQPGPVIIDVSAIMPADGIPDGKDD